MPDSRSPALPAVAPTPAAIDHGHLLREAALAVLAVPAVLRLEPTLRSTLHRLQGGANPSRAEKATTVADGISLRRNGAVVDVHVDIAVSPQQPADLTAAAVQLALRSYLRSQQLTAGGITVAVRAVEH